MNIKYIDIEYSTLLFTSSYITNFPRLKEKVIIKDDVYQVQDIEWNLDDSEILVLLKLFNDELKETKIVDNTAIKLKQNVSILEKKHKELEKKVSNLTDDLIFVRSAVRKIDNRSN